MKQDDNAISELRLAMLVLRADLAATNLALDAMTTTLTPDQMQQALETFAQLSAAQDETAETTQTPEVLQQAMHLSVQRRYQRMQDVTQARLRRLQRR
jgi:hypothetical protein